MSRGRARQPGADAARSDAAGGAAARARRGRAESPLPPGLRARLDADPAFDAVRYHRAPGAAIAAHADGDDVFLTARAAAQPRVVAHELAHVAQQRLPGPHTADPAAIEADASHAAAAWLAGGPLQVQHAARRGAWRWPDDESGFLDTDEPDLVPTDDPDAPALDVDGESLDEDPFVGEDALTWAVDAADPEVFLVPRGAGRNAVAALLLGDVARGRGLDFVPSAAATPELQAVRVVDLTTLLDEPRHALEGVLQTALERDRDAVIGELGDFWVDVAQQDHVARIVQRWGQRSEWIAPSGPSWFDAFLNELAGRSLTDTWSTTKTVLDWVLAECDGNAYERVAKTIALRSHAWTVPYTPPDTWGRLPRFSFAGLFFWPGDDHGMQLQVMQGFGPYPSAAQAEFVVRADPNDQIKIVVPDGAQWYGYVLGHAMLDLLVQGPEEGSPGEFAWYHPGTRLVNVADFDPERGGGDELAAERHHLLTTYLSSTALATSPREAAWLIHNLDYEVLATATAEERLELADLAIDGYAWPVLGRIVATCPDGEFPMFERELSGGGRLGRILAGPSDAARAQFGQAFTLKVLTALPVGDLIGSDVPRLELGRDEDGLWHYPSPRVAEVDSELVAPDAWGEGDRPSVGHEPARDGETPGPIRRNALEFRPATRTRLQAGGDLGDWGTTSLPSQLIVVELYGARRDTRVVSALEAATLCDAPMLEMLHQFTGDIVNIWAWYFAGRGLLTAFGPAIFEGAAAGGWRAAVAAAVETAGSEAGRAALRRFAFEAFLIGSNQLVTEYRDELMQSEEGRTFLAVWNAAMVVLIARDAWKLAASGTLETIAVRGIAAMRNLGATAALRLEAIAQESLAFTRAVRRWATQESRVVATIDPMAMSAAEVESFQTILSRTRQEVASEGLRTAALGMSSEGSAAAQSLISRAETLAAAGGPWERASLDLARRAATMAPVEAESFVQRVNALLEDANRAPAMADLLRAVARSPTPLVLLGEVETLAARALSNEAFSVLGMKAVRGSVDLGWLNGVSLTDSELSFLAEDPKMAWRLFQRAGAGGVDRLLIVARSRVRGSAAEMLAPDAIEAQIAGAEVSGRQVRLESPAGEVTEADFTVNLGGLRHGAEVKGWSRDMWTNVMDAYDASVLGIATPEQLRAARAFEHLVEQLQAIRGTTSMEPILVVSSSLDTAARTRLADLLLGEGLQPTMAFIDEAALVARGRDLRAAMMIP